MAISTPTKLDSGKSSYYGNDIRVHNGTFIGPGGHTMTNMAKDARRVMDLATFVNDTEWVTRVTSSKSSTTWGLTHVASATWIPVNRVFAIKTTGGAGNIIVTNPSSGVTRTASIPANAAASVVQSSLEALSNVGAGNVEVSGSASAAYFIRFRGSTEGAGLDQVNMELSVNGTGWAIRWWKYVPNPAVAVSGEVTTDAFPSVGLAQIANQSGYGWDQITAVIDYLVARFDKVIVSFFWEFYGHWFTWSAYKGGVSQVSTLKTAFEVTIDYAKTAASGAGCTMLYDYNLGWVAGHGWNYDTVKTNIWDACWPGDSRIDIITTDQYPRVYSTAQTDQELDWHWSHMSPFAVTHGVETGLGEYAWGEWAQAAGVGRDFGDNPYGFGDKLAEWIKYESDNGRLSHCNYWDNPGGDGGFYAFPPYQNYQGRQLPESYAIWLNLFGAQSGIITQPTGSLTVTANAFVLIDVFTKNDVATSEPTIAGFNKLQSVSDVSNTFRLTTFWAIDPASGVYDIVLAPDTNWVHWCVTEYASGFNTTDPIFQFGSNKSTSDGTSASVTLASTGTNNAVHLSVGGDVYNTTWTPTSMTELLDQNNSAEGAGGGSFGVSYDIGSPPSVPTNVASAAQGWIANAAEILVAEGTPSEPPPIVTPGAIHRSLGGSLRHRTFPGQSPPGDVDPEPPPVVDNQNPVADFSFSPSGNSSVGTTIYLINESYDPDGDSMDHEYIFVSKPSGSAATVSSGTSAVQPNPPLVDALATQETKALWAYLQSLQGTKTLSGQMAVVGPYDLYNGQNVRGDQNWPNGIREFEKIYDLTGKYPCEVGIDYFHWTSATHLGSPAGTWNCGYNVWYEPANSVAKEHWNNGGIVGMHAHWYNPLTGCSGASRPSNTELVAMVQEGTAENSKYKALLNVLAIGLLDLQQSKIPVIFKMFHEWNFWASPGAGHTQENMKNLYRYAQQYLVNDRGVHNVIWAVELKNSSQCVDGWYPGNDVVDYITLSQYYTNVANPTTSPDALYTRSVELGKPFGFGEWGGRDPVTFDAWTDAQYDLTKMPVYGLVGNPSITCMNWWYTYGIHSYPNDAVAYMNNSIWLHRGDLDYSEESGEENFTTDVAGTYSLKIRVTDHPEDHFSNAAPGISESVVKSVSAGTVTPPPPPPPDPDPGARTVHQTAGIEVTGGSGLAGNEASYTAKVIADFPTWENDKEYYYRLQVGQSANTWSMQAAGFTPTGGYGTTQIPTGRCAVIWCSPGATNGRILIDGTPTISLSPSSTYATLQTELGKLSNVGSTNIECAGNLVDGIFLKFIRSRVHESHQIQVEGTGWNCRTFYIVPNIAFQVNKDLPYGQCPQNADAMLIPGGTWEQNATLAVNYIIEYFPKVLLCPHHEDVGSNFGTLFVAPLDFTNSYIQTYGRLSGSKWAACFRKSVDIWRTRKAATGSPIEILVDWNVWYSTYLSKSGCYEAWQSCWPGDNYVDIISSDPYSGIRYESTKNDTIDVQYNYITPMAKAKGKKTALQEYATGNHRGTEYYADNTYGYADALHAWWEQEVYEQRGYYVCYFDEPGGAPNDFSFDGRRNGVGLPNCRANFLNTFG